MSLLSGDYSIIALQEKDAPALAALERSCFSSAWSEEQYRLLLRGQESARQAGDAPPMAVWGIRGPEKGLVAYIHLGVYNTAGELEIFNIAVSAAHRRQGLGGALLRHALAWAAGQGCAAAFLEVREGNASAIALYRSCGFVPVGRRKGYYSDTGEDALAMRCDLAQRR
jgi:ribosomal-protein-alanine N-acetyltransferase